MIGVFDLAPLLPHLLPPPPLTLSPFHPFLTSSTLSLPCIAPHTTHLTHHNSQFGSYPGALMLPDFPALESLTLVEYYAPRAVEDADRMGLALRKSKGVRELGLDLSRTECSASEAVAYAIALGAALSGCLERVNIAIRREVEAEEAGMLATRL